MAYLVGRNDLKMPSVSIMSNGTSGDINKIDFNGKIQQSRGHYTQMNGCAGVVKVKC